MAADGSHHHPQLRPQPSALHLDLGASCASLLAALSSASFPSNTPSQLPAKARQVLERWATGQGSSRDTPEKLLSILADLLCHDALTVPVAVHFRPILLDLAARLLPPSEIGGGQQQQQTPIWDSARVLTTLHAYATLLAPFPELYSVVSHFLVTLQASNASLQSHLAAPHEGTPRLLLSLSQLLLASHSLIPQIAYHAPQDALHAIFTAGSNASTPWPPAERLLALNIFALLQGTPESTRKDLETRFVGRPALTSLSPDDVEELGFSVEPEADEVEAVIMSDAGSDAVDVWILPLHEQRRRVSIAEASQKAPLRFHDVEVAAAAAAAAAGKTAKRQSKGHSRHASLSDSDLHPNVTQVGGVLLFRANAAAASTTATRTSSPPTFVVTPSLQPTLNVLSQAYTQRLPILLTGTPSSGKTSLIEYIASKLHPQPQSPSSPSRESQLVTLQLGDHSSLDAKSLIGSYTSSTRNPGTFEWVEGALTRAVRTGKWLVLEDIDKATGEILSVIKPLVEAMGPYKRLGALPELDLGPRGKVRAGSTFAIFAVRSVVPIKGRDGVQQVYPPPTFMGSHHWTQVSASSPSSQDVASILQSSFPRLSASLSNDFSRLIGAWQSLQTTSTSPRAKQTPAGSRRIPSLRDLIKWCRRVESFVAQDSPFEDQRSLERIFVEAAEVFLGAVPPPGSTIAADASALQSQSEAAAQNLGLYKVQSDALAAALGLGAGRAWYTLSGRTPDFSIRGGRDGLDAGAGSTAKVRVGRIELPRLPKTANGATTTAAAPISRSFAMTRPAALLLERIAASVSMAEPVLLVGETGTGKTTSVQHLASLLGQPMVALNLSQQTEASDLLGSYKPLEPRIPATEIHNVWSDLFERTFSAKRNARFVDSERKALQSGKWSRLVTLWKESIRMANERRQQKLAKLLENGKQEQDAGANDRSTAAPPKKRKTETGSAPGSPSPEERRAEDALNDAWTSLAERVADFAVQHASKKKSFVFSFIEGPLVKALREGHWVLLDEVNLAASETLDSLASLLQSPTSSLTLFERGDIDPVPRHPNFRLFACMNPATDVGKKDLPASLRSRFTELYVQSPDADREALVAIVEKYIGHLAAGDRSAILDVAECYAEIRRLAAEQLLADGANQRPHFSIRTLARALTFASDQAGTYGLRRALWEGFTMAFTMLLDNQSCKTVKDLLDGKIIARARNARQAASFVPPMPKVQGSNNTAADGAFIQIGPFWLQAGPEPLDTADDYILTPSVQSKLIGLARAILARKSPVLIQGPTSAGKTSAVEHLARRTGHRFVRINNHEHTDVQEYLGSYASDPDTGRLVFHEGLLVKALRRGEWIVLDELNLAPTDVLEALNRLLDDNRELIIPETGEVVRPHPSFMLFATQNPPGIYAGRKVLSRAFRNRFLELHFDDVPRPELETILTNRCAIPPSYAAKVVAVFVELQKRRQAGRVFDTKQAFVTLRDLFRWGQREAQGYQQLAENGYMLIAERARRPDDKAVVKEVIEDIMKAKIDADSLYDFTGPQSQAIAARIGQDHLQALLAASEKSGIVWTRAMQRLVCLVATSLRYDEPVLLVGETGAGKTSVCEVVASACGRELHTVNCHQNTDTADLLGGQRPLRNRGALQAKAKAEATAVASELSLAVDTADLEAMDLDRLSALLSKGLSRGDAHTTRIQRALQQISQASALFEWQDGPLVEAMRSGDHLLLDEVSLADDSVLERLNSVLEPGRTLVLAERSGVSHGEKGAHDAAQLRASDGFEVVATMNPGGDYGKKELSPALRNRFTEIWVPQVDDREDILRIFAAKWARDDLGHWGTKILDFVDWFAGQVGGQDQAGIGLRDLLSWVAFMNAAVQSGKLDDAQAFGHGAMLAFVDGVGALTATAAMTASGLQQLRCKCIEKVQELSGRTDLVEDIASLQPPAVQYGSETFGIGPFHIETGPQPAAADSQGGSDFSFRAQTTAFNAVKVLRALYVPYKAILLEGSPGAGKTSLITALASSAGHNLTRINLSDQTELIDLFGADLPVEGGGPGEFAWKDAAFLKAMQSGEWVLLDEMNLASQSVLEGLNSCLDHRGSVFIPELGRSFDKHPEFKLFAAQNPHQQGGGRKGLPKSFLNRFTKVFVEELQPQDILTICSHLYPAFAEEDLTKMIRFNALLHEEVMLKHAFGRQGAPWEFNLRDLLRWLALIQADLGLNWRKRPIEHLGAMYIQRFRTASDRRAAAAAFERTFGSVFNPEARPWPCITPHHVQFGHVLLERQSRAVRQTHAQPQFGVLQQQLPALEALADCAKLQWLFILVGPAGSGKTSLVRLLASLVGVPLEEMRMNSGIDTMDVLGTFEQVDPERQVRQLLRDGTELLQRHQQDVLIEGACFRRWCQAKSSLEAAQSALVEQQQVSAVVQEAAGDLMEFAASLAALSPALGALQGESARIAQALQDASTETRTAAGRFEWNDGPLLRAMQQGSWLLLDDANMCSASVLDRLNSLFEPGGFLVLSERGVVDGDIKVVRPHPNFRLFMALDPSYGELSRAMRNRGLEIHIGDYKGDATQDLARLHSLNVFRGTVAPVVESLESTDLTQVQHAQQLLSLDAPRAALESFLLRALPLPLFSLASHVLQGEDQRSVVQVAALIRRMAIAPATENAKLAWQSVSGIDRPFLLEHSADLSINPSLWDDDAAVRRLRVALTLVSGALALHRDLYRAAKVAPSERSSRKLSVLQRSALMSAQASTSQPGDGELEQESRLLYPFARAVQNSILDSAFHEASTAESLEALSTLLDHTKFLLSICGETAFDFSSTQIVMEEVQQALPALQLSPVVAIQELASLASALHKRVTLTSGLAMHAIWELCMSPVAFPEALPTFARLSHLLSLVKVTPQNQKLASTAIDVCATLSLSSRTWTNAQQDEILSLARQVVEQLDAEPKHSAVKGASPATRWEIPVLAALQLQLHTSQSEPLFGQVSSEAVKEVVHAGGYPLPAAVLMRKAGWQAAQAVTAGERPSLDGFFAWAQPIADFAGCDELFRPFLLHAAVFPSPATRISMSDLLVYRQQCAQLARLTALSRPAVSSSREASVRHELAGMTLRLLSALGCSELHGVDGNHCEAAVVQLEATAKRLATQASSSESSPLERQLAETQQQIATELLQTLVAGQDTDLTSIGEAAISIGLHFLHLYLPNIAIDPLASLRTREAMSQQRLQHLEQSLRVALYWESLNTSNQDSPLISHLREKCSSALAHRQEAHSQAAVNRDPNVALLSRFFRDVHSFTRQMLESSKLKDIVKQLRGACDDQALARESSIQSSLQSFRMRLASAEYLALTDLSAPLRIVTDMLQVGFRSLLTGQLRARLAGSQRKNEAILDALVKFPATYSSELFAKLDLPIKVKAGTTQASQAVPMLITALSALHMDVEDGKTVSKILRPLSRTYDQIFYIWNLDKEQERKAAEEESSIFKSRGFEIEDQDDEEAQEREFRSMFPEFSDIMDSSDEPASSASAASAGKGKASTFFRDEHMAQISALHLAVFLPSPSSSKGKQHAHSNVGYMAQRNGLIRSLLSKSYKHLSEDLDRQSATLQLSLLSQESGQTSSAPSMPNFYLDADVQETSKGTRIVEAMRSRLDQLVEEWPEQMVLQHIRDRCDAILRLDSASPVAKVLAALEQLLVHSQDWEGYANSSNSLASHRSAISDQIIAWRRLELSSWAKLLETQADLFSSAVSEWWFRLYEVAIRGMQGAMAESDAKGKEHLGTLVELLDQFVRSSSLGNFEARLHLVESFGAYLTLLAEYAPSAETRGLERVARVFANVTAFYSQFRSSISSSLDRQRSKIEKEVRDFIQLASWKDVNIHALKQSAQKSHRKLHKCVRQFRDVLRQPVDPILANASDSQGLDVQQSGLDIVKAKLTPLNQQKALAALSAVARPDAASAGDERPKHLQNLARTYEVLQSLVEGDLSKTLSAVHMEGLDELAVAIITQSQALAKATPALAKEDNQKVVKNLTNRKRKAWTDLLRELKRIGLTPFVSTDLTAQNRDPAFVYEQTALSTFAETAPLDRYFYRLLTALPRMRDSLHAAQGDVTMAELQRGASYCEHGMNIVFRERSRLATVLGAKTTVDRRVSRLAALQDGGAIMVCPSGIAESVRTYASTLSRISAMLAEITAEAGKVAALSPLSSVGLQGFLATVQQRRQQALDLAQKHSALCDALNVTEASFWLESEAALPAKALVFAKELHAELVAATTTVPALEPLCVPASHWLERQSKGFAQKEPSKATGQGAKVRTQDGSAECDRLISSILLVAQDIKKVASSTQEDEDLADKAVSSDLRNLQTAERSLRFEEMERQIRACLVVCSRNAGQAAVDDVRRITPFVSAYGKLVASHAEASLAWQRSFLKLIHVMTNTVTSLALKGFCKPPEEDQSQDGEGGDSKELEGGTGLGDGSGAKDITDQMEEDETIEELQKGEDEGEEGEKGETQREKNAREAEEDFGGDLEEVSGDEQEQNDGESDAEGEEQEPDDHVGDVDPLDPNAVDEKVWGGEQDEKKEQQNEKDETKKDLEGTEGNDDDSAPKEDGGKDDSKGKESASERKDKQSERNQDGEAGDDKPEAGEDQQQDGEDGDKGEDEGEEGEGSDAEIEAEEDAGQEQQGLGRKLDEEANAGENLDINDDLKMSDEEGGGEDGDEDDLGDLDLDNGEGGKDQDPEQDVEQGQDFPEDAAEEFSKTDDGPDQADLEPSEAEVARNAGEDAMDEDEADEAGEDEEGPNSADGAPQDGAQDRLDGSNDEAAGQPEDGTFDDVPAAGDVASTANQSQGAKGQQGRQAADSRPTAPDGQAEASEQDGGDHEQGADAAEQAATSAVGAKADNTEDDQAKEQPDENAHDGQSDANPIRSLGDALKEFRRNLDSIAEASPPDDKDEPKVTDDSKADGEGMPQEGDVEHVRDDEDAEMQAVGAADTEDIDQRLGQDGIEDRDKPDDSKPPGVDAEMQEAPRLEPAPLPDFAQEEAQRQEQSEQQRQAEHGKALLPSDIQTPEDRPKRQPGIDETQDSRQEGLNDDDDDWDNDVEEEHVDPVPEDERSVVDHQVEEQLTEFRSMPEEDRLAKAGDLWRSYSALTSDLAFALCEQLRLILTPTLAARLNGDFRTGKRLNMRKIVPFIASDFAKDKIWLRRAKPSKREYQVLLALDDSRSMAENRSVHLAFQTLALVSGALSRLEVGDISICRFGDTVQTLHPFGKGTFGDESGAGVIEKLSFEQKSTNVVRLVEHTLASLQEARNSRSSSAGSAAAELWQLQIIISDGVCQDHERLRSLLRRANEQRVMIVFVIVDSVGRGASAGTAKNGGSNSILSMSSVRYETDPKTGKMELKMDRYLDSFPFSYYVVLREAEALPEVLATTLRQWAEKIREAE